MHPRSRGATPAPGAGTGRSAGLSPLTRGNPGWSSPDWPDRGPIPAHAGQPSPGASAPSPAWAYPRSRGATAAELRGAVAESGLSPLTRGNHAGDLAELVGAGPIPAHAGQPEDRREPGIHPGAYPRSRGATGSADTGLGVPLGLSPLTRGNRGAGQHAPAGRGPIPAHAGQPFLGIPGFSGSGAYPRSRGATRRDIYTEWEMMGLSPLTRGNLGEAQYAVHGGGPIPAHAGQPSMGTRSPAPRRAYPRSRGATDLVRNGDLLHRGLSPLTRGNRQAGDERTWPCGPIPAHAGQPCCRAVGSTPTRAYPRSRGATSISWRPMNPVWGLSPLTRGNLGAGELAAARPGPIPAHAGQPSNRIRSKSISRAYPRSRGATYSSVLTFHPQQGLSPLTRGNRDPDAHHADAAGPIPAHAGQPNARRHTTVRLVAYPRSRGATSPSSRASGIDSGLSPLTRGNRSVVQ